MDNPNRPDQINEILRGKLPLKQVNGLGDLNVENFEGMTYPFEAFESRNKQLDTLTRLYDGDLKEFVKEQPIIVINEFQKVSKRMAELMMAEEPQFSQEVTTEMMDQIYNATYDVVINMMTYGLGLMTTVEDKIDSQNPSLWYPGKDDVDVIVNFEDYTREGPQTIIIDVYDGETVERRRHEYRGQMNNGQIRAEKDSENIGRGMIAQMYRLPIGDAWGTSIIPNLLPLVLGKAGCYSRNDKILDKHSRPVLVVTKTAMDLMQSAQNMFESFSGDESDADVREKLAEQFQEEVDENGVFYKTEADQKLEYVTWDGQLEASFRQIEELGREINDFTGYTGDLTSGKGIPSGVALRRLLLPLYVATQALQNEITKSLIEIVSFTLGTDVEVDWPHPLVVLDDPGGGQGRTPTDNNEQLPQSQLDEREPNVSA